MLKKITILPCSVFVMMMMMMFNCVVRAEESTENPNQVWATVGSEVIDEAYVEAKIKTMPPSVQHRNNMDALRTYLLQEIIDQKLFADGARQVHLDNDPEIKFRINDSTEQILAAAYKKYIEDNVPVSDAEVKAYYEKHRDRYHLPEQFKLHHLAVQTKKEAEQILIELKKGADFAKIANEKSIYKTQDGDLGWIQRGMLNSKLEEKVFKMKKGQLSGVIEVDGQYHIVRVDDYKAPADRSLKELEQKIREQLRSQKKEKAVEDAKLELQKKFNVQITNLQ